jgi:hypothetical protein
MADSHLGGSGRSSASSSGPTQPSDTHQPTHLVIGPLHPHVRSSLSSTQASDFSLLINFLKFTSERFKSYGILSTVQLLLDSSFLVVFKDKKDWRSASPPSSPLTSCCSYYGKKYANSSLNSIYSYGLSLVSSTNPTWQTLTSEARVGSFGQAGPTQPSDTHWPTHLVIGPSHLHGRSSLWST